MKTNIRAMARSYRGSLSYCIKITLLGGALALPISAATINFDSFINQSGQQGLPTHQQISNAINAAGNGGTVNFGSKTYTLNQRVNINKSVNLIGRGKNSTIIKQNSNTSVFIMSANNVAVRSMRLRGNGIKGEGVLTFGRSNIQLTNSTVEDCTNGVANFFGKPVNGLVIDGVEFLKIKLYGIWLISTNDRQPDNEAKRNMGHFRFDNNTIRIGNWSQGQPDMGINIDYGNERRADQGWTPSHLGSQGQMSLIRKNNVRECGRFGIAVARAGGILIEGNLAVGGTRGYSQALHLEDRLEDITAQWNRFYNNPRTRGAHAVAIESALIFPGWVSERVQINNNWLRSNSNLATFQSTDTTNLVFRSNIFEFNRADEWDILLWRNNLGGNVNPNISGNRVDQSTANPAGPIRINIGG